MKLSQIVRQQGRPLPYPYTLGSMVMQFPWKFHYNNVWVYKFGFYSFLVCLPIFYKIQRASMSQEQPKKKDGH